MHQQLLEIHDEQYRVVRLIRTHGAIDDRADDALTRIFRWKMSLAGLDGEHLASTMRFDRTYVRPRSKLVTIKDIKHRGSECPVIVEGTPEALRFAWLVGAGELTGSGCGGLR